MNSDAEKKNENPNAIIITKIIYERESYTFKHFDLFNFIEKSLISHLVSLEISSDTYI